MTYNPILIIDPESTSNYGDRYYHLNGWVAIDAEGMTLDESDQREVRETGGVLFARDWHVFKGGLRLHGIRVKNQSDRDRIKQAQFYAHEVGIEGFVTLEKLEYARPTLQRIAKRLAKMRDEQGNTEDVAQWLARVALAMGCKRIAIRRPKEQQFSTGERFRVVPIGDAVDYLRHIVFKWREEAA